MIRARHVETCNLLLRHKKKKKFILDLYHLFVTAFQVLTTDNGMYHIRVILKFTTTRHVKSYHVWHGGNLHGGSVNIGKQTTWWGDAGFVWHIHFLERAGGAFPLGIWGMGGQSSLATHYNCSLKNIYLTSQWDNNHPELTTYGQEVVTSFQEV